MTTPVYTERRYLYEILVRGRAGEPLAAHQQFATETLKDGIVISFSESGAMPLAIADVADVLGETFVGLVNERDEAVDNLAAANAEIARLEARIELLTAALGEQSEIARLRAIVAEKSAAVAEPVNS